MEVQGKAQVSYNLPPCNILIGIFLIGIFRSNSLQIQLFYSCHTNKDKNTDRQRDHKSELPQDVKQGISDNDIYDRKCCDICRKPKEFPQPIFVS